LGANPTPMAFSELYTALQQGTVDGQENPLGIITGNGFQEVEKYCTLTEHVYTPYYVVMNLDKWNSLSADQQEAVSKAMAEATTYQYEQSQKYEDEAVGIMEDAGCTVTVIDEDTKLGFKEAVDKADCLSLAKDMMDNPDLADQMQAELDAYRK
ncbi:MAG: TRAP transporter substrate-binding protein, partial [Lachnospiraceae bacterium]|nr:TRAP transporter substrate-binding protein [Lachnospiraceae bacterium]